MCIPVHILVCILWSVCLCMYIRVLIASILWSAAVTQQLGAVRVDGTPDDTQLVSMTLFTVPEYVYYMMTLYRMTPFLRTWSLCQRDGRNGR